MDPVGQVADAIKEARKRGAELRIGVVTALESGPGSRARLDILGNTWLQLDTDSGVQVGDRVYAFQQGSVVVIGGRLTGAQTPAVPIGSLTAWAGSSTAVPAGWVLCDGQLLDRTAYAALFAVIGTTYGNTNTSNFRVPDLTARFPIGVGNGRSRGATGGAETVTLTTAQIPGHTHGSAGGHTHDTIADHTHNTPMSNVTAASGTAVTAKGGGTGAGMVSQGSGGHTHSSDGSHTHSSVGGGGSHENMPPYLTIYYIILAS